MESTLILLKPDVSTHSSTVQAILADLSNQGLAVHRHYSTSQHSTDQQRHLVEQHYSEHAAQPWYPPLLTFMLEGPILVYELTGVDAIRRTRSLLPQLRTQYGTSNPRNAIHASDGIASAQRELALWF